jgi:hypothetical protein
MGVPERGYAMNRRLEHVVIAGAAFFICWLIWGWQAPLIVGMP